MENIRKVHNLIVGAGPAGLSVAARLRRSALNFEIVEKSNKIANAWHHHYDRLCLHTVKQHSTLPYIDFPDDYPLYVPRLNLIEYYENYATAFDIKPHFNYNVTNIKKTKTGWFVKAHQNNLSFLADNIIIATGTNRVANIPTFKNQESYIGHLFHCKHYKNAASFKNKKVLIVGIGNSGAEIALDLAENNVNTTISIRSPINVVPRDLNGNSVQVTAKKLAKLPFGLGDWVGATIRRIYFGDLTKYGIPVATQTPLAQLRTTGKTPVIDLGTIGMIKKGKIAVRPDIAQFTSQGVVFTDGKTENFDTIILATGYKAQLHDFIENIETLLDKNSLPKSPISPSTHEGLYFVGFDNYKLGGILGTIQTDSATVVAHITQKAK